MPSDLIVTLLTELAELENERLPQEGLNCFINTQSPKRNLISVYVCVSMCGFLFFCCCVLVTDVVVLALSRRPVPPSSGKTLFALAEAPWMQVLKSSLPPQFSGETGTTSFRKKKKKVPGVSSAMELLCPPRVVQWGAEISGGKSSLCSCWVALPFFDLQTFSFVDVYFRTASSSRPVCKELVWHCAVLPWQDQSAKHGKECVQSF